MKLHKTWAAVLFLCVCVTMASAQTKKLRVVADSVNIYIEPHKGSSVIGTVSKGTILTLFDSGAGGEKSWFYVSFYSEEKWATITGFVESSKVSAVGAPAKPRAEESPIPKAEKPPAEQSVPPPAKTTPPEKTEKITEAKAEAAEAPPAVESPTEGEADEAAGLVRGTGEVKVTGEKPAIRATAADDGRILMVAKFGEVLELNGRIGPWYRVKYPRPDGIVLVGFVNQAQVEVLSSTLPEEEPAVVELEPEPEEVVMAAKAAEETPEEKPETTPVQMERAVAPPPEPAAAAQETSGIAVRPLSLAFNAGYALPSESAYEGGFVFGGDFAYLVNKNLAVVLGFYRYQSKIEGSPEGLTTGKLTSLPISLGIQGRYPVGERLVPYAAAGVAYHFNTFKLCQMCQDQWDALGFDVREEVENALGFQVGVGLDYQITDYIDLNLDVRYQFLKGSGSWSMTDQFGGPGLSGSLEDLNFNALILRIGAKIFLNIL
jgi:outer membrane protein W